MAERDWADEAANTIRFQFALTGAARDVIADELRRVRAEALESAAKICDGVEDDVHGPLAAAAAARMSAAWIARHIRALAKQEPKR